MPKLLIGLTAFFVSAAFSISIAATVVGWRTDGLSQYPKAQPTTEWSAKKNVVWQTTMPSWSNCTPVVLADRIITCSEPTDLVCLNKADGKILWKVSNAYADVMSPDEAAQAEKDKAEAEKIRKEEVAPLEKERAVAQKAFDALQPPKPKAGTTQAATAPTTEQVAAIDAAKKQLAAADAKLREAKAKLVPLSKWFDVPGTHPSNGQSSASPVSDGSVVGIAYNTGVAAVYDVDGKRKWARLVEKPNIGNGSSASPQIFGDKLLVHFQNLKALDLATGKEIWTAANTACHYGSATIAHIGNFDVAITAAGDVVNLADGQVLLKRLCPLDYNSPIYSDGVAYFIQNGGKAVKISAGADGKLEAKTLWTTKPRSERYYSSPLLYNNLIYAINQNGHLSVIDAATGEVTAEKDLDVGKSTVYASVALGGKYLFISGEKGQTVILEPGKEFKEIGRNSLEQFRGTPIFEGTRMYIRGHKAMYCIGE